MNVEKKREASQQMATTTPSCQFVKQEVLQTNEETIRSRQGKNVLQSRREVNEDDPSEQQIVHQTEERLLCKFCCTIL